MAFGRAEEGWFVISKESSEVLRSLIGHGVQWIHAPSLVLFERGEIACSEVALQSDARVFGITATCGPSAHPAWDRVELVAELRTVVFPQLCSEPDLLGDYSSIVAPFGVVRSISLKTFLSEEGVEIDVALRFSLSTGRWFEVGMAPADIPVVGVYMGIPAEKHLNFANCTERVLIA